MRVTLPVNTRNFLQSLNKISEQTAMAIVRGVAITARDARDAVRQKTRSAFGLRSDYIPQSIRSMPDPGRAKAIAGATRSLMGRRRSFQGAVYLKGSSNQKKSLAFLVDHELGNVRKPVDGRLAVPVDVRGYRFRGSRGAVLRRWKPATLLAYFNQVGGAEKGSKRHGKRRGKPKAFILRNQIVRRKTNKSRELEVLYTFARQARLKRRWGFVETSHSSIKRGIGPNIVSEINKLR